MEEFGKTKNGEAVFAYTLRNPSGMTIRLMTRGAALIAVTVPDRAGNREDVVFGFDSIAEYESVKNQHFGCTTGRCANRISNGQFSLDGIDYQLATNIGPHHLHGGGERSLDKVVWAAELLDGEPEPSVRFSYTSPDGEENYPGNLDIKVTYTLTGNNEIRIVYAAKTDKNTPVNLTNHAYFNLSGAGDSSIHDHVLMINADQFTAVDDELMPTGEIVSVVDTPLDFRTPHAIGDRVAELVDSPSQGYDHNYVLNKENPGELSVAAVLHDPDSGRVLTVSTTEPGVQFYGGNSLKGQTGKQGKTYARRSGCCFETQHFPDSVNQPNFPSIVLAPGKTYSQTCVYAFSVRT